MATFFNKCASYHNVLRKCESRGASLVEAAFALPLFLFFLISTFELFWIGYSSVVIQHITTNVMRQANTTDWLGGPSVDFGNPGNPPSTQDISNARAQGIKLKVKELAEQYGVTLDAEQSATNMNCDPLNEEDSIESSVIYFDYINNEQEQEIKAKGKNVAPFINQWGLRVGDCAAIPDGSNGVSVPPLPDGLSSTNISSGGVGGEFTMLVVRKKIPLFLGWINGPSITVSGVAFGRNDNFEQHS